jgi:hypothetical protein
LYASAASNWGAREEARFDRLLRSQPLRRALFRYSNDQVRRSLENCFQLLPSFGHEKLRRLNQEETGWVFIKDPDFGHSWMLLHHDSTTYANALEKAAIDHRLIRKQTF